MKHPALLSPALLPVIGTLLTLAACSTPPPLVTNCPSVAVLEQGSTLTVFLPGRTDIAAQITHAQITGVAGTCAFEKKKHQLQITFQAGFMATNGPANTSSTLNLPYLVSVSQGDTILAVTNNLIPLKFDGNASTAAATTKPIKIDLPNNTKTANLDILVSFHLTPDQLTYNNAHPAQ